MVSVITRCPDPMSTYRGFSNPWTVAETADKPRLRSLIVMIQRSRLGLSPISTTSSRLQNVVKQSWRVRNNDVQSEIAGVTYFSLHWSNLDWWIGSWDDWFTIFSWRSPYPKPCGMTQGDKRDWGKVTTVRYLRWNVGRTFYDPPYMDRVSRGYLVHKDGKGRGMIA